LQPCSHRISVGDSLQRWLVHQVGSASSSSGMPISTGSRCGCGREIGPPVQRSANRPLMWNCCRHQRVARATGRPSGFPEDRRCRRPAAPKIVVRLFPAAVIALCPCHLCLAVHGAGAFGFVSQSCARCGLRLHPLLFFLDNSARPSPTLIGIVSVMTRRGRSAVAKSRPTGEPEGRDARRCAHPGFGSLRTRVPAQNAHPNYKSRRLN
jgi:hypothetical protein